MVEAVVTLAVLGIIVAAAMPSMSEWIRSTHVRNLAETTQAGLQRARNEALKRNQVITFWLVSPASTVSPGNDCVLASDSGAWVVSVDNPASKCASDVSVDTAPRIVERFGPGKGAIGINVVARDAANAAATSVSFNGYGQTTRAAGQLAFVDISHPSDKSARELRVLISASGSVRMCDKAVSAPDPRAC